MEPASGENESRLSAGGWAAIVILAAFLGWAAWYAIKGWGSLSGVAISSAGWVWLILGGLATLVVGGGLMALLFYSSRKNFDR